jgi:2-succinyl-5-enolpyruvyl-6-hydroxy-3-cyclohexene-1-carboxylate synthase
MDASEKKISDTYLEKATDSLGKKQICVMGPSAYLAADVTSQISNTKTTLFVLGPEITVEIAKKLRSTYPDVPFLIDVQSPACYQNSLAPILSSLDLKWSRDLFIKNPPEQIIHFGEILVSKYFYETTKTIKNLEYWNFHKSAHAKDPAATLTHKVLINATDACLELAKQKIELTALRIDKDYIKNENNFHEKFKFADQLSFADLAFITSKQKVSNTNLFIGNSTLIRAFEKYAHKGVSFTPDIFSNRGVSGIEGNIATAIGLSKGNNQKTISLLGDISFLYDLNSLGLLRSCSQPQIIIVANNHGGGIFKMLNFKGFDKIASYMTTPHETDLEKLAMAYQITFNRVHTIENLHTAISSAIEATSHLIIEVIIDDDISMKRSETLDR